MSGPFNPPNGVNMKEPSNVVTKVPGGEPRTAPKVTRPKLLIQFASPCPNVEGSAPERHAFNEAVERMLRNLDVSTAVRFRSHCLPFVLSSQVRPPKTGVYLCVSIEEPRPGLSRLWSVGFYYYSAPLNRWSYWSETPESYGEMSDQPLLQPSGVPAMMYWSGFSEDPLNL